MAKRAIPAPPVDRIRGKFDSAVKENLEVLMGMRGEKIEPLLFTASTEDIIKKINEVIARLQ